MNYRKLEKIQLVNSLGFYFYHLLFNFMKFYFHFIFPEVVVIYLRHSLKNRNEFSIFFSDIDTTFVLKDSSSFDSIINHFRAFKFFFPMFDLPEFYTQKEQRLLELIEHSKIQSFVDIVWHFRKINRILQINPKNAYENTKNVRALEKSYQKIFETNIDLHNKTVSIKSLRYFNQLFQEEEKIEVCIWSPFLGSIGSNTLIMLMSKDDFLLFNCLMAGESNAEVEKYLKNTSLMGVKLAIEARELLLAKDSIRKKYAFGENVRDLEDWKNYLESRKSLEKLEISLSIFD